MRFASGDASANGRRPRGPVNIGSKRTCVAGVLHCIGLENRLLDPCMSSFFEAFVASPTQTPFKTAFEADLCRNCRFLGLNLGANMGEKTRPSWTPPHLFVRFGFLDAFWCLLALLGSDFWPVLGSKLGVLGMIFGYFGFPVEPSWADFAASRGWFVGSISGRVYVLQHVVLVVRGESWERTHARMTNPPCRAT